jgi:hypothetical protein
VDEAGAVLVKRPDIPEEVDVDADAFLEGTFDRFDWAMVVINNWRACHSYPLQVLKVSLRTRAKKIDKTAIFAQ